MRPPAGTTSPGWRVSRGGLLRLTGLALLWGSAFLWVEVALRGFSPVQITFTRLALGAAVLVPLVLARGGLPRDRTVWAHLVVAALVANAIPYTLFAVAQTEVASSIAGVLSATTPLWTLAFQAAGGTRDITGWRIAGLLLGFVGVLLVFQPWQAAGGLLTWAALACLAAAASYGVAYVYQDRYLTRRRLPPTTLAAGQLLAATGLLALALPADGTQPITWRADAVIGLLILGALSTGAAYVLNFRLITDDGPAASIVTYLLPIVAVTLGVLALAEPLTIPVAAGTTTILLGVAIARRRR